VAVAEDEPDTRWIRLGAMDFIASRLRERAGLPVLPAIGLPTESSFAEVNMAGR